MLFRSPARLLLALIPGALLSFSTRPAAAQAPGMSAHGYDFMTVITDQGAAGVNAQGRATSKIIFIPAFQGHDERLLQPLPTFSGRLNYNIAAYRENLVAINQQLGEITAAGWELVQLIPPTVVGKAVDEQEQTRYLFRKPRP